MSKNRRKNRVHSSEWKAKTKRKIPETERMWQQWEARAQRNGPQEVVARKRRSMLVSWIQTAALEHAWKTTMSHRSVILSIIEGNSVAFAPNKWGHVTWIRQIIVRYKARLRKDMKIAIIDRETIQSRKPVQASLPVTAAVFSTLWDSPVWLVLLEAKPAANYVSQSSERHEPEWWREETAEDWPGGFSIVWVPWIENGSTANGTERGRWAHGLEKRKTWEE